MAELLIQQGCVVNACDKRDRRPLHYAAYQEHEDLVRLLLNHEADVNVKDRGVSETDTVYTTCHIPLYIVALFTRWGSLQ